jgi:hypothetical protein
MAETPLPTALTETVGALWRIPRPGPGNLLSDPRFIRLRDTCDSLYPKGGPKGPLDFALYNALRALGLPSSLTQANGHLTLPPEVAAARLDAAFRRTQVSRVYLCPLDLAGEDLPDLKFGPNSIRKFTTAELEALVDPPRLKRFSKTWTFDAKRFSEFCWLVVEEACPLDQEPGARPLTILDQIVEIADWGRIEPHKGRFPTAVEGALFAVLLAPWEDWVEMAEDHWRGFRVPWVYTLSDDIFVWPPSPPSPDTLSWRPDIYFDADDNVVFETEQPERLDLNDAAAVEAPNLLNDEVWCELARAKQSPLFETPIAHFLVHAFLTDGVDEFLAHITTIEAALGLQSDYDRKTRPKIAKRLGPTACVATRVSSLLGAKTDGEDYCRLFDIRSLFLHGREMEAIPGEERIAARRLARRVVNGLVKVALAEQTRRCREDYLNDLLTQGLG